MMLLLALAAGSPAAATSADITRAIVETTGGTIGPCPDFVREWGDPTHAVCVRLSPGWRPLRKAFNAVVGGTLPVGRAMESSWIPTRGYHVRHASASDGPLRFVFDAEHAVLAVLPGHPCFDAARVQTMGPPIEGDDRAAPRTIHRVDPEYPEEARARHADGWAALQAIIGEDGSVRDVCLIESDPPTAGFGEAAIRAVKQWRFAPPASERLLAIRMKWTIGPPARKSAPGR
jgi:TonB family protein